MGIKWEGIKIVNSALGNAIYLAKLDSKGMFATDKSDDRTSEVIDAVASHMDRATAKGDVGMAYASEAGRLAWIKSGFRTREDLIKLADEAADMLESILNCCKEGSKEDLNPIAIEHLIKRLKGEQDNEQ